MPAPKPESFVKGNPGAMVMKFALDQAAKRGRKGDDTIGHLTKKDLVIPMERQKGEFDKELGALLKKHGIDRNRFTVGSKGNSMHPETGLPEFADGDGGDTGGGGAAGEGGQGGPGDPAGSPDSGAGGASTGTGGTGGTGAGGPGSDLGGSGPDAGPLSGSSGTKSATAADESAGFTGISASDFTGPNPGGKSVSQALGLPDLGLLGTVGKIGLGMLPGVGPALTGLSLGNTLSAHGVDQPSNPGGNLSSGQTGGVGMGLGATTDPGAGGPGAGGSATGTVFGSPTQLGATALDQMIRNAKVIPA